MMIIGIHSKVTVRSSIVTDIVANQDLSQRNIDAMRSPQFILHQIFPILLLQFRIIRGRISESIKIQRSNLGSERNAEKAEHGHGQINLIYYPIQHNRLQENKVRYTNDLTSGYNKKRIFYNPSLLIYPKFYVPGNEYFTFPVNMLSKSQHFAFFRQFQGVFHSNLEHSGL